MSVLKIRCVEDFDCWMMLSQMILFLNALYFFWEWYMHVLQNSESGRFCVSSAESRNLVSVSAKFLSHFESTFSCLSPEEWVHSVPSLPLYQCILLQDVSRWGKGKIKCAFVHSYIPRDFQHPLSSPRSYTSHQKGDYFTFYFLFPLRHVTVQLSPCQSYD